MGKERRRTEEAIERRQIKGQLQREGVIRPGAPPWEVNREVERFRLRQCQSAESPALGSADSPALKEEKRAGADSPAPWLRLAEAVISKSQGADSPASSSAQDRRKPVLVAEKDLPRKATLKSAEQCELLRRPWKKAKIEVEDLP